jgi:hypothetical protein
VEVRSIDLPVMTDPECWRRSRRGAQAAALATSQVHRVVFIEVISAKKPEYRATPVAIVTTEPDKARLTPTNPHEHLTSL